MFVQHLEAFPRSKYVILSEVLIAIEILSNPPMEYANT